MILCQQEMPLDKISVGEMSVVEMSVDKISVDVMTQYLAKDEHSAYVAAASVTKKKTFETFDTRCAEKDWIQIFTAKIAEVSIIWSTDAGTVISNGREPRSCSG
jgi:hypothetical protein